MDLQTVLDEENILDKCLKDMTYLASFISEYEKYLNKIDWIYFLIVIIDSQNTWNDIHIQCIKSNLHIFYNAIYNKKININYKQLKELHSFAQQTKGKKYYKQILYKFPEIKKYAFKLYRKNIIEF